MFCETLALGVQDKHWNMDGELIAKLLLLLLLCTLPAVIQVELVTHTQCCPCSSAQKHH